LQTTPIIRAYRTFWINGLKEVANAYSELNDPIDQERLKSKCVCLKRRWWQTELLMKISWEH
jgi:hypothetical protein